MFKLLFPGFLQKFEEAKNLLTNIVTGIGTVFQKVDALTQEIKNLKNEIQNLKEKNEH